MKTKTLIIGAGPAGCACGITSRKKGIDSIVVEKARLPRVKLCAGLVTGKALSCLKNMLGDDFERLMQEIPVSHSEGFTLLHNYVKLLSCKTETPIAMVERPLFDNWLAQYYKSIGGALIEGTALTALDLSAGKAMLSNGQEIEFETLVAADGANSTVARLMRKRDPKAFSHKVGNALCIEMNIDREDIDIDDDIKLFFGVVDKSYAWSFTQNDKVCLGLVKFKNRDFDAKQKMLEFCRKLGVRNLDKYPVHGAMLPIGEISRRRAYKNVLFAGDAAGLVEPPTGEGIYYALQSGCWAAESASCEQPDKVYERKSKLLSLMIKKNAFYQKLLECRLTANLFFKYAGKHPSFVKYFYETQIDSFTLDSFLTICKKFIKSKEA